LRSQGLVVVLGSQKPVVVSGSSGSVVVLGSSGSVVVSGSSGSVVISGSSGSVVVSGPSGSVVVAGSSGLVVVSDPQIESQPAVVVGAPADARVFSRSRWQSGEMLLFFALRRKFQEDNPVLLILRAGACNTYCKVDPKIVS